MNNDRSDLVRPSTTRRERMHALAALRGVEGLLGEDEPREVGDAAWSEAAGSHATVVSAYRLQDVADYRGTLRAWFGSVRLGGSLIVVVPHAFLHERRMLLPGRWLPGQRRLYTPASLLTEVEEALVPNSYRVRLLCDDDRGYDYGRGDGEPPAGHHDIVLAIEKIALPEWTLEAPVEMKADAPDYAFEPARTRIEVTSLRPRTRILILKLDHLGDFVMSVGALEKTRALFPESRITLVVGSWNVDMARALGLADEVIAFDAFPRNSTEEEVDVPGTAAVFRSTIKGEYDIAIDMRTDYDTRFLLRSVDASIRAGIGTRAQFPYLDIFLPLDFNRNEPETAREYLFAPHDFPAQGPVERHPHRIFSAAEGVERFCAIVWGPYRRLRPGRYFFEPYLEFDAEGAGLLKLDIGLDAEPVTEELVSGNGRVRLRFEVTEPDTQFEFRIWTVEGAPSIDFSFFGGRLVREGAASVLHQSEYQSLLIQLVSERIERKGMLEAFDRQ